MAAAKFHGLSLSSMDAVNCAPVIERRDFSGGRVLRYGFSLRVRARAVLWPPPVTVREAEDAGISRTRKIPVEGDRRDPISLLNERIRREHCKRESPLSRPAMDAKEADMYIQKVKEQQQRGLQKLKGERTAGDASSAFTYKVDPYSLRSGDYVVHKKVGIGRFVGVKYDVPKGAYSEPIEYVFIEYADGMAKLPLKQASRMLYRYNLPNEIKKPRTLSKLNDTSAWEKRRIKGKVAVQKMVVDLMELYLHRLKQKRPPYPKVPAVAEFASQFPYEPTPDQKQAFMDVERDLTERENPMDRLICGDVGFGKTEVALRAIFCVVSASKQAMVLAPTIVLAKQHFDVISERFSRYHNIKVGLLSRFQTKSEKEIHLQMIKDGELDIIVGTHSLLGDRVVYNNLGLLVVDEEQLNLSSVEDSSSAGRHQQKNLMQSSVPSQSSADPPKPYQLVSRLSRRRQRLS